MSHSIPAFTMTPLSEIAPMHARLTETFLSGKTRSYEFRKRQLRKLYHVLVANRDAVLAALKKDLNKPTVEALSAETNWLESDIMTTLDNFDSLVADEPCEVPLKYKLMGPKLQKNPLGTVLVIGPFNYPAQLVMIPLIGAIAAGCTCMVKPSELTPHTAAVIAKIVEEALDPDCYAVVNGGVEETTRLLDLKWDKIMYTGSSAVGRIVSQAAAKHLTPVLLELGGLNPVLITSAADTKLAGPRVAWGKVLNAGQVCLSPDYVLVDPSCEAAFAESFIKAMQQFFPNGTQDPDNLARIVNERHFHRILGMLEKSKGKVVFGGRSDLNDKWIEPTLIRVDSLDDSLLSEEIFGPLLPYVVVPGGVQEMLQVVRRLGDCPLALYAFTRDKKEQEMVLSNSRSGGVTFNDTIFHGAIQSVPFGGVGESGTGVYRGKYTFEAFTHKRPVLTQPSWIEGALQLRYPPFSQKKIDKTRSSAGIPSPNFDRDGKLLYDGLFWKLALLGASRPKDALLRYLVALMCAFAFAKYGSAALANSTGALVNGIAARLSRQ